MSRIIPLARQAPLSAGPNHPALSHTLHTPATSYIVCLLCLLQEAPLTAAQVADLVDTGDSEGGGVGQHWVLDPIDGTRGFVGMRQYAVCLGMLQEGEVSCCVVLCIALLGVDWVLAAWLASCLSVWLSAWACCRREM